MAENSNIEWTDHTFNPWSGCHKVSPACTNCYAAALPPSMRRGAEWGPKTERKPASESYWAQPIAWNRAAQKAGKRARVFCASVADVFEARDDLDPWRARLFALIEATPNLDWLLLTKRPDKMMSRTPVRWATGWPANVWAGTTVEDQRRADERIPHLLKVPAAVRFLSCEPLLGPLDLVGYLDERATPDGNVLQWVIAGGESGHGARPSRPEWFQSLRQQCASAGVPYLFKQWGNWAPRHRDDGMPFDTLAEHNRDRLVDTAGAVHCTREVAGPGAIPMSNVGKKLAGRLLDGVTHDGFPGAA